VPREIKSTEYDGNPVLTIFPATGINHEIPAPEVEFEAGKTPVAGEVGQRI
jgi:hypothetical protein